MNVAKAIKSGKWVPMTSGQINASNRVDWVECGLPAIKFQWIADRFFCLSRKEAEEVKVVMKEMGFPDNRLACSENAIDKPYSIHLVRVDERTGEPRVSTRVFMNFRRYSWCATQSSNGEQGYGGGVDYCNGIDGGPTAHDAKQVVRESFVRALAELDVPDQIKYHYEVKPVLNKLLEDALANMTGFADNAVNSTNGQLGTVKINGVQH